MKYAFIKLLIIVLGCYSITNALQTKKAFKTFTIDQKEALERMHNSQGPQTFLLSYPHSGNTWLRYCIEYLTSRPTIGNHRNWQAKKSAFINEKISSFIYKNMATSASPFIPLAWIADFTIEPDKAPVYKVHNKKELERFGYDPHNDKLIFVLRNPKESVFRKPSWLSDYQNSVKQFAGDYVPRDYFDNITLYDQWNSKKKLLIYYEDLIQNPSTILKKVLNFLPESDQKLPEFLAHYHTHTTQALGLYNPQNSSAKSMLFHSQKLGLLECKKIDVWIGKQWPKHWNTYLKMPYKTP